MAWQSVLQEGGGVLNQGTHFDFPALPHHSFLLRSYTDHWYLWLAGGSHLKAPVAFQRLFSRALFGNLSRQKGGLITWFTAQSHTG